MTKTLLIQSCSGAKKESDSPLPALELYTGYFYRIIKKAQRTTGLNPELDILILSAKHGILQPDEEILPYDQRMNKEQAEELRPAVLDSLTAQIAAGEYERVIINVGKDYLHAVEGLEERINTDVEYIEGSGIGVKGSQLKELVRRSTVFDTASGTTE